MFLNDEADLGIPHSSRVMFPHTSNPLFTMPSQPRMGLLALFAMAPVCSPSHPLSRFFSASPRKNADAGQPLFKADAPALPFVPFAFKATRELKAMLAERHARRNRLRHRPPLALAMVALLSSTIAVIATSPTGESAITATVPVIKRCADDVESVVVEAVARERGLDRDVAFNR